ncbi:MAG TPA: DUF3189 family protein [Clostridiales bacterium]|nr:DUF3189 family protein [Clostridiales bacterium]
MDIIYCGYFATYEAYLCALIHIGMEFDCYSMYSYFELCRKYSKQFGNLIFVGLDHELNRVYAMGCKEFTDVIINSQSSFREIYDIGNDIKHIDTTKISTSLPHIIEKIGDNAHLYSAAKWLFYYWCRRMYPRARYFVKNETGLFNSE